MNETAQLLNIPPVWQIQSWSATLLPMSVAHPPNLSVTQTQSIDMQSTGLHSSFTIKKPTTIGGLKCLTGTLESQGKSGVAVTLITNSQRQGSISNHRTAWRKWSWWCSE